MLRHLNFQSEYLEGLTLVDEELTRGKTIRYLNVEELPENEMERLATFLRISF